MAGKKKPEPRTVGRTKRSVADGDQRRRTGRFKKVFGTAAGQEVLDDLYEHLGFGDRLYAADVRMQEQKVARNDVGVWITEQMNWKPGKGQGGDDE